MGHRIQAIISKGHIDRQVSNLYDLPVFFNSGFSIIALDVSHSDYWAEQLSMPYDGKGEIILDCAVTHYFAKKMQLKLYAIISTEYFGGWGEQYAVIYNNDSLLMKETEGAINQALKIIGVNATKGTDEFDTIGLGQYRSFDRYFKKYY